MKEALETSALAAGVLLLTFTGLVAVVVAVVLPYLFAGGVLGVIGFGCWWVFTALTGMVA